MSPLLQKGRCHQMLMLVKGPLQLIKEEGLEKPSSML
ncbi:hypothetical protein Gotur_026659 [Gossypium turneri]